MNVAQEPLDFRCVTFSVTLSLLMPTSAFPFAPTHIAVHLRPKTCVTTVAEWNAPLPLYIAVQSIASVQSLSPENYRRWVA